MAFKCKDTIAQLLKPANNTTRHTPRHRSGIYSLTCCTCQQAYVGSNQQEPEAPLPRAYKIHQKQ
jgi:hypothetical protein